MKGKETHASKSKLQIERLGDVLEVRVVEWGGFDVSFYKALADIDVAPLLKGLPDDRCQCPHWGFLFKGKMIVRYKDHEETVKAGEAYHMASGHTALITKGTESVEFSPKSEIEKTMVAVMKNMQALEAKKGK